RLRGVGNVSREHVGARALHRALAPSELACRVRGVRRVPRVDERGARPRGDARRRARGRARRHRCDVCARDGVPPVVPAPVRQPGNGSMSSTVMPPTVDVDVPFDDVVVVETPTRSRSRLHALWRGREEDAVWVRPAVLSLLAVTAVLYLWGLGASGWANS